MQRRVFVAISLIVAGWIMAYAVPFGAYEDIDYGMWGDEYGSTSQGVPLGDINSVIGAVSGSIWEFLPILMSVAAVVGLYLAGRPSNRDLSVSPKAIVWLGSIGTVSSSAYVLRELEIGPGFGFFALAATLLVASVIALTVENGTDGSQRASGTSLPPHIKPVGNGEPPSRWGD